MGRPKALLPYGRTTFSRSIIESLQRAGIDHPLVVIGHDAGPIAAHLSDLGPRFVYNRDWPKGQLTSLQSAIRACPASASGILVMLVDQPGLRAATVRRMIREHRRRPRSILVAAYRDRPGHPVIFPRRLFRELLAAPLSQGARAVVRAHLKDRRIISTADPAVVRDVDTKKEFRRLCSCSSA